MDGVLNDPITQFQNSNTHKKKKMTRRKRKNSLWKFEDVECSFNHDLNEMLRKLKMNFYKRIQEV